MDEVDGLLLRLLDRVPAIGRGPSPDAGHVRTFRVPQLERLQHAAAAALVSQRFGTAGLATVVADGSAPIARRYFAFLALAERHPPREWPVFERYLRPEAHHAFVGAAAEAARFYPAKNAGSLLVRLFDDVRQDAHLRDFLGPRILRSLYVLRDPTTLPFLRELLVAGHTHASPEQCEVTQALVIVRSLTGRIEPNSKYVSTNDPAVSRRLDAAEHALREASRVLEPVVVI